MFNLLATRERSGWTVSTSCRSSAGKRGQECNLVAVSNFRFFVSNFLIDRHQNLLFMDQLPDRWISGIQKTDQVLPSLSIVQRKRQRLLIPRQRLRHPKEPDRDHEKNLSDYTNNYTLTPCKRSRLST